MHPQRILESLLQKVSTFYFLPFRFTNSGYNVLSEDFKFCIILDACRFDAFAKVNTINGDLFRIWSTGSRTGEWFENTFKQHFYANIIYISANPFLSTFWLKKKYGKQFFYKMVPVWDHGWNWNLGTVHPEQVNKAVLRNIKKHPNHKFIIHYLQPHYPFIATKTNGLGLTHLRCSIKYDKKLKYVNNLWHQARNKKVTGKQIERLYFLNLKLVLEHVKQLLPKLEGKTIITSDHGNLFGKYGHYAHPRIACPELRVVPLLRVRR